MALKVIPIFPDETRVPHLPAVPAIPNPVKGNYTVAIQARIHSLVIP
jgi:hypothetical protein